MLLALSDPGTVLIAIGTCAGTLAAAWLAYKRELISRAQTVIAPAAQHANDAERAAEKAEQTAMAFASGFSDLYRKIEECQAEAREAKDAARASKAAEDRCIAEQKRLEAIMEGIIDERRRQH